jgi:uncharacterized protein YbcV (DUF1398 family)
MEPNKEIPSPYMQGAGKIPVREVPLKDKNFLTELDQVFKKYGHQHYFTAFEDKNAVGRIVWQATSNDLNELMVQYLELIIRSMRETWNQIKPKWTKVILKKEIK